jgi:hypothetical protein
MECPHIPEISHGEYMEGVYQKMLHRHLPMGASLELTERCNLNCAQVLKLPGNAKVALSALIRNLSSG